MYSRMNLPGLESDATADPRIRAYQAIVEQYGPNSPQGQAAQQIIANLVSGQSMMDQAPPQKPPPPQTPPSAPPGVPGGPGTPFNPGPTYPDDPPPDEPPEKGGHNPYVDIFDPRSSSTSKTGGGGSPKQPGKSDWWRQLLNLLTPGGAPFGAGSTQAAVAGTEASALGTAPPAATGAASSPYLSNAALNLYGNVGQTIVQAYSANKANKQQQAATDAAMQLQREVLAQQQANQQPYMQAGNASLQRLNAMLTPKGQTPAQVDGPMIMVVAPTGQRMSRPASEAQHWQALGAQIEMPIQGVSRAVPRSGGVIPMERR